ncbi:MAG TPA: TRAP transporter small permease [Alphaproteobacteria bacterium]
MLEIATVLLLVAMVLTTLIGVADRFLMGLGMPWPEELARFLLIWTSLLAAAVAAKHRQHFQLAFLYGRLGRLWATAVDLACIAALGVVIWQGIRLAQIFHFQTSPALGLPMSVIYASAPVSALLIAGYIARDVLARWRRGSGGSA